MSLAGFGSLHVGGRAAQLSGLPIRISQLTNAGAPTPLDPNGTHWVEAMYAQYFVPQDVRFELPLLMWHGGGLTGACWEGTPDGREGWLHHFVRRGWTTFSCDAVERGRSGFPPVPQVFAEAPVHQPAHWAWERFRIGTSGSRFPVDAYGQFVKQLVPRWTGTDDAILRGYLALLDEVGPCCVLAHSQGGQFAWLAAQARPGLVRALVLVEPSGVGDESQAEHLRPTPVLVVQGDGQQADERSAALRARIDAYLARIRSAGVDVDALDLPAHGITGNSHMMMLDLNSEQIAGLIADWLGARLSPAAPLGVMPA